MQAGFAESGPTPVEIAQIWPNLFRRWPSSAGFRRIRAKCARIRGKFDQDRPQARPNWRGIGQLWAEFDRLWADVGDFRPTSVEDRPDLAVISKLRPTLGRKRLRLVVGSGRSRFLDSADQIGHLGLVRRLWRVVRIEDVFPQGRADMEARCGRLLREHFGEPALTNNMDRVQQELARARTRLARHRPNLTNVPETGPEATRFGRTRAKSGLIKTSFGRPAGRT